MPRPRVGKEKVRKTSVSLPEEDLRALKALALELALDRSRDLDDPEVEGEAGPSISEAIRYLIRREVRRRDKGDGVAIFRGLTGPREYHVATGATVPSPSPSPAPPEGEYEDEGDEDIPPPPAPAPMLKGRARSSSPTTSPLPKRR